MMKSSYSLQGVVTLLGLCVVVIGCAGDVSDNESPLPCRNNGDCSQGYVCSIPGGASIGECVSDPCAACIAVREECIDQTCVPVYPYCNSHADCRSGEYCEQVHRVCLPLDADADTDDTPDISDPDIDDMAVENDIAVEETPAANCRADSDCQAGWVCTGQRICIKGCVLDNGMCDAEVGATCNPRTHHCECCDPMCNSGESCNFNSNAWYCGSPCEPPCPEGYACSGGSCLELRCPNCPPGYSCSAETCYTCQRINVSDGDVDTESSLRRTSCIPGLEPCRQGIDSCCSGVCFEGRCM